MRLTSGFVILRIVMFNSAKAEWNITILRMTNPDVNLKRMHQIYNDMITVAFSENNLIVSKNMA